MKRFLAFVLLLTMVLPMALVAQAEEAEVKPFYGLGWSEIDESKVDNVIKAYTINIRTKNDRISFELPGVSANVDTIAEAVKKEMDRRKEGTRYLLMHGIGAIALNKENSIYLDNGTDMVAELYSTFMEKYHAIGGKLDGVVLDLEYIDVLSYYIYAGGRGTEGYATNKDVYKNIVEDPRYETEVRPMLVERGFQFYENPEGQKSEIFSIYPHDNHKVKYPNARNIWDTVMRVRLNQYLNTVIYEPTSKYFPDAVVSDYDSADKYAWDKNTQGNGVQIYTGGNNMKAGNASNYVTYGGVVGNYFFTSNGKADGPPVYTKIPGYNKAVFEYDAFNLLLFDINNAKDQYAATDTKKFTAWIAEHDYSSSPLSNTAYWTETIFHLGMLNPEPFLVYMYRPDFSTQEDYDSRVQIISEVLDELTRVAGFADRKPIETPSSWNVGFVLSGMYAGGRNIWRITPDTTDGMTVAEFKTDSETPTFYINGKTIIFPQGKIIEDGAVGAVGTAGYWVETPKDVMPVITTDADCLDKNPSYFDSFEAYEAGTEFTSATALPKTCWNITENSKLQIVSQNNNQALAITGTATLKNVNIPKNITAGDNYAKNQAWEISFTIPTDIGSDGELQLLFASDTDGGFKIAEGKVYYDEAGSYKELSGVTIFPGKKYTARREFDFTDEKSFTCDYTILDADGNQIAQVKDIALGALELPVASVGFACKHVSGEILLDDYKLFIEGLTTDFETYDAKTGRLLSSASEARTADTAYRLSWANATAHTRKVNIYAGDKLIKTVEMAPGDDGVETGIVTVEEGQSVTMRMELESVPDNTENPDTTGDPDTTEEIPDNTNTGNSTVETTPNVDAGKDTTGGGTVAIVIVCAVAIIGGVVAVFLAKKKKTTKELPADTNETDE